MADLGYNTFESEWVDHADIRDLVREKAVGEVLNLPCGQSPIGDMKADVEPSVNPDVVCDMKDPPFEPQSFDTVYCDPPYDVFTPGNRMSWFGDLYDLARDRLIIQGPNTAIHVGGPTEEELYCLKPKPGSSKRGIRVLQIIKRPDNTLTAYE